MSNEWIKKALSIVKREEQPNMDGNVLARRIVAIAVKEKANGSKGFFFLQIVYWLNSICCAICADRVQSGLCLPSRVRFQLSNNGRVRVVHLRHFSGLHGFGSVPCSTFTGLFGFGYFWNSEPWRPLPDGTWLRPSSLWCGAVVLSP